MPNTNGSTAAEWVSTGSVTVRVPGKVNLFLAVGDRRDLYTNLVSGPNHAMLIVGAQAGQGPAYQVENSWGAQNAAHPYLTMTDGWLQHFGGEIVVHRDVASPAPPARAQDITFYPFWDIFGTLA